MDFLFGTASSEDQKARTRSSNLQALQKGYLHEGLVHALNVVQLDADLVIRIRSAGSLHNGADLVA